MSKAEFDQYADDYAELHRASIAFSGCEPAYFARYKTACAAQCFQRTCEPDETLLDFGCGTGTSIPYFRDALTSARLIGADVSGRSLDTARRQFSADATFLHIGDGRIDLPDASAGMAFSACVFHHIPPGEQAGWLRELHRVVRPGGALLIFEHNPFNPLTRRAVASCAFDKDAILLRPSTLLQRIGAAGFRPQSPRYHVFFPGFLSALRPLEQGLGWLPLGGQYSVLAIKP